MAIHDAKNTEVLDPSLAETVRHEIERAEEELAKAGEELRQERPDKAVMRLGKAWLHAQVAVKYAIMEANL